MTAALSKPFRWSRRACRRARFRLLRAVYYSEGSRQSIAMGAAVGMFVGLTPTLGIHLGVILAYKSLVWGLLKAGGARFRALDFNAPLAVVFTFVCTPPVAPFFYFAFYALGCAVLPGVDMMGFQELSRQFHPLMGADSAGLQDTLEHVLAALGRLGYAVFLPMAVGCLFLAVPASLATYYGVDRLLRRYARRGGRTAPRAGRP